jgi:histidinol-phosphate aminotransferase
VKIRDELLTQRHSYAANTPERTARTLDCSLGVNPYGFPAAVAQAYRDFDVDRLYHYPHSHAPQAAIVDYWAAYAYIEPENIVLTDGSIAALYLLCNILSRPGAEVVGFVPSFTDMIEYARMMGMRYTGVPARPDGSEDVEAMLEAITKETSLVYIDNPNNPTGQFLSLSDIDRVLAKCEALGVYAIIDEAYGDFLPREESAVTLGPKYHNIIIVRTFSKGFGLAGVRAGYIITNQRLISYIGKVSNPYMMSEFSRELAAAALTDRAFSASHADDFAAAKRQLRAALGEKMFMQKTDDRVPICTLTCRDEQADLQALLLKNDLLTCSGAEFEPLLASSARLRVPKNEEVPQLIAAVAAAAGK